VCRFCDEKDATWQWGDREGLPQKSCGDEPRANAQHDGDDGGFVPGILQRPVPLSGRLQYLKADAQRQKRGGKQRAERAHVRQHSTRTARDPSPPPILSPPNV